MTEADERLAAAADRQLSNNPEGQLVQLLFTWIAEDEPDWLTPTTMRDIWPTEVRFEWLLARPDVRARVVHVLTGISEGAARRLDPDVQIALVDAVIDNGDVPVARWAAAFEPHELAAHAPPGAVHSHIRACFPWMAPPTDDRRNFLFSWLEAVLSRGDGNGRSREPILDAYGFRTAIDPEAWQANVPLELRAQVDGDRLKAEQDGKVYSAADEMGTVSLETLVEHLPHSNLHPVLEAAERALGIDVDFEEIVRSHTSEVPLEAVQANEPAGEAPFTDEDLLPSDPEEGDEELHLESVEDDDEEELPAVEITRTEHTEEVPRM